MQGWRSIVALLVAVSTAWAADYPTTAPVSCANGIPGGPACVITAKSRKEAKAAFERGMKLEKARRLEEALPEFEKAADLVPQEVQYVTLREMVRQELVFEHVQRGNTALANGQQVQALGEFRTALHLDPTNDFARQRLNDSLGSTAPQLRQPPRVVEKSNEIHVVPKDQPQTFHFRGDSRALLTQVAAAYGVVATFDDSVVSRRLRFDLENVDFYTAMRLAGVVT
jgi:general secretion pathway protein D